MQREGKAIRPQIKEEGNSAEDRNGVWIMQTHRNVPDLRIIPYLSGAYAYSLYENLSFLMESSLFPQVFLTIHAALIPYAPGCVKPVSPRSRKRDLHVWTWKLNADSFLEETIFMRTEPAGGDALDLRELLSVLTALKKGDFTVRLPLDQTGVAGKIADTLNDVIETNQRLSSELSRISNVVGKEGKTGQRAALGHATGGWGECIDSVNTLIVDLVQPTTEVARVIGAVANGDLSQTMALEIDSRPLTGEFLRTAKTVNTMVDQLGAFASEVTRVASVRSARTVNWADRPMSKEWRVRGRI